MMLVLKCVAIMITNPVPHNFMIDSPIFNTQSHFVEGIHVADSRIEYPNLTT